jgi:hypothetical protein
MWSKSRAVNRIHAIAIAAMKKDFIGNADDFSLKVPTTIMVVAATVNVFAEKSASNAYRRWPLCGALTKRHMTSAGLGC